jgi:opacity protein-like surface antigen
VVTLRSVCLRALAAASLMVLASLPAAASEWQITPMLGVTFRGNTSLVDIQNATGATHKEFGGEVTVLSQGIFGAEGVVSFTPGFFHVDRPKGRDGDPLSTAGLVKSSYAFATMGNVVVAAPRRYTEYFLRPFVSAGLGVVRASVTDAVGLGQTATGTRLGFDIGGGAVGFLTQHTGVRFELRYYSNVHSSAPRGAAIGPVHLRYMVASIGLVFRSHASPMK